MGDHFKKIYREVERIPKGKVATYGLIAKLVSSSSLGKKITPRLVGLALHKNPDSENIPCHRVVNSKGRVSKGYAFGGAREQKKKLLAEGVSFKDKIHVDLEKHIWRSS